MYLEFIKDIFKPNDKICIVCDQQVIEGVLLKISDELIALKTETGIIIKKDEEISDVYSVLNQSSNKSKTSAESNNEVILPKEIEDKGSIHESIEDQFAEEINNDVAEDGISTPKNDCISTLDNDVFELDRHVPGVKVVGFLDLSTINDPKKKRREKIQSSPMKNDVESSSNNVSLNSDSSEKTDNATVVEYNEKKINKLLQAGSTKDTLNKIDELLSTGLCEGKYKSTLLLKKAQTYSALSMHEEAKVAYQELIYYNESIKSPSNNLSHLYTELARLQNLTNEDKDVIIKTLNKALKYNPNNTYASSLIEQVDSNQRNWIDNNHADDGKLMLEMEERSTSISKMIDIDIKEHSFTNVRILKNGGVPTPNIAKSIFDQAQRTRDVDLSERYPIYLEAAKAYSVLPVGSYNTQEYLEAIAYYAILKGNSLFVKFKKLLYDTKPDISLLTHIKDSACSYYVESLNLLSNIEGEHLLTILTNYLKMNIALVDIKKGDSPNIRGQFNKVFFNCISSSDTNMNLIAWEAIVTIGTASARAWNKLFSIKGGTGGLHNVMLSKEKDNIYSTLNRINDDPVDVSLSPGEFLKKSFKNRSNRNKQLRKVLTNILVKDFNIHMLTSLDEDWRLISDYIDLLSETDQESKNIGDKILQNLLPYSIRQSQIERTNLLIQAQQDLESQISFINENTTYYGRAFFFPLFTKWKTIIQQNLQEKISKTLPALQVLPDPPYLVKDGVDRIINLIINNVGESTAEGYNLKLRLKSADESSEVECNYSEDREIPVGYHFDKRIALPANFSDYQTIEVSADISAIYQSELMPPSNYKFTLESEPEIALKEEDIIWKDGPKMSGPLFKGRQEIMDKLVKHYLSIERDKPYILYGLTRTGKSSILLNLKKELENRTFLKDGHECQILPIEWDLSEASGYGNAKDMWQYFLRDTLYDELDKYLGPEYKTELTLSEFPRAKDLKRILLFLKEKRMFPIFFIDEFSHIKIMLDNRVVNTSFLHTLRQFSLEGLASFIYAGTYDIKELIKDPKYAITGQLVHTIEEQISEIDAKSAEELVNIMKDKLTFTDEAIKHIHLLSGDVPYFIQIICKCCGFYAVEKKRRYIGKPELENVIKILTGEIEGDKDSLVKVLPKSTFQNNLYSPQDKKEVNVLISSLCSLNNDMEIPRGISIQELHELWSKNGIDAFRPKLAEAITLLLERKVLVQSEDEYIPVYRISVDLFRRWWRVHYPDIKLEITTIQ